MKLLDSGSNRMANPTTTCQRLRKLCLSAYLCLSVSVGGKKTDGTFVGIHHFGCVTYLTHTANQTTKSCAPARMPYTWPLEPLSNSGNVLRESNERVFYGTVGRTINPNFDFVANAIPSSESCDCSEVRFNE